MVTSETRATVQEPDAADGSPDAAVLRLADARARDRAVVGGKAAALATAVAAGCPVVPGFVITVHGTAAIEADGYRRVHQAVEQAWKDVIPTGAAAVARSSSVVEDAGDESMAGRYETVADVAGPAELAAAVREVMASRHGVAATTPELDAQHPIAVLVQQQISPDWGGVAFGVDPVTGRPDRRTIAVGRGAPEELVSGTTDGDTWVFDADGRVITAPADPSVDVDEPLLRQVLDMVDSVGGLFDAPQDVEWGASADGSLWLLQSRPVTTAVSGTPTGPVLGTGPIAETFPDAMAALEADLWVPPLREAIAHALQISAVASSRDVDASPVMVLVDGRPAVDLELFGRAGTGGSPIRDRVRRIAASWRLGRLRGALPAAGRRVATRTDAELAAIDPMPRYTDDQLMDLLHRASRLLRTLHGHEILIGLISEPGDDALTGTGVALRLLASARREGLDDATAVAREPAILALCPPRIGRSPELPDVTDVPDRPTTTPPPDSAGVLREALRMRVRWVHELTARTAEELGRRLADQGLLDGPVDVRHVALDDLSAAVAACERPRLRRPPADTPLPNRFRLTAQGEVVPQRDDDGGGAVGAGGGSATGPAVVLHDGDLNEVADGSVLVVDHLGPELAPVLGRIAGLVSETGSPLSHIAILARESGVATVVGMDQATQRFADGGQVTVDGAAGTVEEAAA